MTITLEMVEAAIDKLQVEYERRIKLIDDHNKMVSEYAGSAVGALPYMTYELPPQELLTYKAIRDLLTGKYETQ